MLSYLVKNSFQTNVNRRGEKHVRQAGEIAFVYQNKEMVFNVHVHQLTVSL